MDVKNRWLKIDGRGLCFNLPPNLKFERDKTYPVALNIDIKDIQSPSNDDGSMDVKYVGKATGELVVNDKDAKDTVMLKVDKRRQSQKLRGQIVNTCKGEKDVDDHYDERMTLLRHFWYLIDPYLDQLKEKENNGEL
jgi:hypothetical protein